MMADLIDRQAALNALSAHKKVLQYIMDKCGVTEEVNKTIEIIYNLPAADAIEVVRCKDCKWYELFYTLNGNEFRCCCRETKESLRNSDDYCSNGERK